MYYLFSYTTFRFFLQFSLCTSRGMESRLAKELTTFFRMTNHIVRTLTQLKKKIASVDYLIGESVLFKCSVTCMNICTQSESTKWSRELFLQMCLLVRVRSAYLEPKGSFLRQMCLSMSMYSAYLERKSSFFRVIFR